MTYFGALWSRGLGLILGTSGSFRSGSAWWSGRSQTAPQAQLCQLASGYVSINSKKEKVAVKKQSENTYKCMCIYIYVHVHIHTCIYVYIYLYIYICICMCIDMCIYICITEYR